MVRTRSSSRAASRSAARTDGEAGLDSLPPELLARIVALLPTPEDVARVDCAGRLFHEPPPLQPPQLPLQSSS